MTGPGRDHHFEVFQLFWDENENPLLVQGTFAQYRAVGSKHLHFRSGRRLAAHVKPALDLNLTVRPHTIVGVEAVRLRGVAAHRTLATAKSRAGEGASRAATVRERTGS